MLFRIRDMEYSGMPRKSREALISYIEVILVNSIYSEIEKQGGGKSLIKNPDLNLSSNAHQIWNEILLRTSCRRYDRDSNMYMKAESSAFENLRALVNDYLEGKNGGQIDNIISTLLHFNPDCGKDQDAGIKYTLYQKRMGLILNNFLLYIKNNAEAINSRDSKPIPILSDSEKENDPYTRDGVSMSKLGYNEDYDFTNLVNITRDFTKCFCDTTSDFKLNRVEIAKLYNIYLRTDSNTKNVDKSGGSYLIGRGLRLNTEDYNALESLLDYTYNFDLVGRGKKNADPIGDVLYSILTEKDDEYASVLSDFFAFLVKCRIRLPIKNCPYFLNMQMFSYMKVFNVEDFRDALNTTTLVNYMESEFPLLKGCHVGSVIDIHTTQSKSTSKVRKRAITESIMSPSTFASMSVATPIEQTASKNQITYLISYLTKIVKLRYPCGNQFDFEVISGINRDTILDEDVKKAFSILKKINGEKSFKSWLQEFSSIINLFEWNVLDSINLNESKNVLQVYIRHILNLPDNRIKLVNLWKLIKKAHNGIISFLDEVGEVIQSPTSQDVDDYTTKYGVKIWEFMDLEIPLVYRNLEYFYVYIYNYPLQILESDLNRGRFEFDNVTYEVTSNDGVLLEDDFNMSELLDLQFLLSDVAVTEGGIIPYQEADELSTPSSIMEWLRPSMEKMKDEIEHGQDTELNKNNPAGLSSEEFLNLLW